MDHLDQLEHKSVHILREAYANFKSLCMLWSIGKDSTVLLWLARKSFFGHVPFPLVHVDTSFKIPEMIRYRDRLAAERPRQIEQKSGVAGLDRLIGMIDIKPLAECGNFLGQSLFADRERHPFDRAASRGKDIALALPDQHHADVRVPPQQIQGGRDRHPGAVVAPHAVDCDRDVHRAGRAARPSDEDARRGYSPLALATFLPR